MAKEYDLEDRLVKLAGNTIRYCSYLPNDFAFDHLSKQLIRSISGACLNYGEAQGAESRRDFIHKMGISLKELKESRTTLKILEEIEVEKISNRNSVQDECGQLVAIFASIILKTRKGLDGNK